jgi:hypothetical protein
MFSGTIGTSRIATENKAHRKFLSHPRRPSLHDNTHIDIQCRALWADVLSALETRITSVNRYVPEKRSHILHRQINPEAVLLHHASSDRSVVASLDLIAHSIHIKEYHDRRMEHVMGRKEMPLSLLADGELYVTDGNELMSNSTEVAKALLEALLTKKAPVQMSA